MSRTFSGLGEVRRRRRSESAAGVVIRLLSIAAVVRTSSLHTGKSLILRVRVGLGSQHMTLPARRCAPAEQMAIEDAFTSITRRTLAFHKVQW